MKIYTVCNQETLGDNTIDNYCTNILIQIVYQHQSNMVLHVVAQFFTPISPIVSRVFFGKIATSYLSDFLDIPYPLCMAKGVMSEFSSLEVCVNLHIQHKLLRNYINM